MLPVEIRLFLATAGGPVAENTVRDLLRDGVRWGEAGGVLATAVREGVGAPFGRRIRQVGGVVIDPQGLATLREIERADEFRMRFLEQRLGDAVGELARARIPVLLVDGTALGCTSYASFADLAMDEIDLVVPADGAAAAVTALAASGWRPEGASLLADTKAPMLRVAVRVATDVLPPAANPFAWTCADLWSRAERPARPLHDALVPARSDRLLHCCIAFGWSSMFRRRAWRAFRDLALIVAEGPLDWPSFGRSAQQTRAASVCYWTLRLAHELCDLTLPLDVLRELGAGRHSGDRIGRHLARHLVPSQWDRAGWIERLWWSAAIRPGRSGHGRMRPWTHPPG